MPENRSQMDPARTLIDNVYYDRLGDDWWSREGQVGGLHAMNPARADYFHRAIEALGRPLAGARLCDVGCGGGILAEELARRGAVVTGVDRSIPSLGVAHRHGKGAVRYAGADAGTLPFADAAFDGVVTSDFLEHVHDLDGVSKELARIVKPGGFVCFDTINRTFLSRVIVIWVMEIWLKKIPRHTHDWKMFITPDELTASFAKAGLEIKQFRGIQPAGNPIGALLRARRNALTFETGFDRRVSYVGIALKR
jgi:2-polyprenyl-6-hydroxyphenyl methylase/3-demethylubiquinone-9 3-methyltransferase